MPAPAAGRDLDKPASIPGGGFSWERDKTFTQMEETHWGTCWGYSVPVVGISEQGDKQASLQNSQME